MSAHLMVSTVASLATERTKVAKWERVVLGIWRKQTRSAGHHYFMIIIAEQVRNLLLISGRPYNEKKLMMCKLLDKVNILLHRLQ